MYSTTEGKVVNINMVLLANVYFKFVVIYIARILKLKKLILCFTTTFEFWAINLNRKLCNFFRSHMMF